MKKECYINMLTPVRFTKMHGLGNDFVVIDAVTQNIKVYPKLARKIAHRHLGIGCDQVLIVEPPIRPEDDFFYRIFNSNGSEAKQCGNGARCVGRFMHDEGLASHKELKLGYKGGQMTVIMESDGQVTALLGPPSFEPDDIPIKALRHGTFRYHLSLKDETKDVTALSLGNPHCVFSVATVQDARVQEIGRQLQKSAAFPEGVNVGFMQILARNHIKLRVFERGAGETYACGSGACAAVIAGIMSNELSNKVQVDMKGGQVVVSWPDKQGPVHLTGPTSRLFDGLFLVRST